MLGINCYFLKEHTIPNVFLAVYLLLMLHCGKNVSIVSDFSILIRGWNRLS